MFRRTLNLGIVAHVDAGKTTLTERLLYDAGVIGEIGSVDKGTTQTDSLALEQERGITIRSAVVSFVSDNVVVDLVDTPGHPDFIAEVERVLGVLDGAVLVISAVEGVQPQTRLLLRALQRLRLPTLMFVNKVDRSGADCERVLAEIQRKLTPAAVAMTSARREGFRDAVVTAYTDDDSDFRVALLDVLAEQDDSLLADYLDDERSVSPRRLRRELQAQTERVLVHPVFYGSAITGAGVAPLMRGIRELLPADAGDTEAPASGLVFKLERGSAGDRVAYLRMFSGTVHTRDRVHFGRRGEGQVTAISVFADGTAVQSSSVAAGEIAKLWGLGDIQIGDRLGDAPGRSLPHEFPPPTLEAVVEPLHPGDRHRLHVALAQLAEQDPLINVRQDLTRQEIAISLYGEVQKEVIEATLGSDFGIAVAFSETIPIYIERPIGTAEARELLYARSNPFLAEIGLRVDPAPAGTGLDFRLQIDPRTAPLYLYHTREGFTSRMNEYVRGTLDEGLHGWKVTDCAITMTHCAYSIPDGPPSRRGPPSTAADFRKLTPIVLMHALQRAGTAVCEPMVSLRLEVPASTTGAVLSALARLGGAPGSPSRDAELALIEAVLPAVRVRDLQRQLRGPTGGEGVLESSFAGYRRVGGQAPTRQRTTASPLDLDEYRAGLAGHRAAAKSR